MSERKVEIGIFLFLLGLGLLVNRGHFETADEVVNFETTKSLVDAGTLAVQPVSNVTVTGADGQQYGHFGIGQPILTIPFYMLGRMVDHLVTSKSWRTTFETGKYPGEIPWGGRIDVFFVQLFGAVVLALTGVVFYNMIGGEIWEGLVMLGLLLSTQVFGLSSTAFEHPLETLLTLLIFYFLADYRLGVAARNWGAGIAAGVLVLVRFPSIIVLPVFGLYFLHRLRKNTARDLRWRAVLWFTTPIAVALALNCWVSSTVMGKFILALYFADPDLSTYHGSLLYGLHGLLFSPSSSIFLFNPILLLYGMMLWRRRA